MKKKESFGITIFGVIFILIGLYFSNIPYFYIRTYFPNNPLYRYFYENAKNSLNSLSADLEKKENLPKEEIYKKIENLNKELENYKKIYLKDNYIPIYAKFIIFLGLIIFFIYIFCGIAILRLFKLTYKLIFLAIFFGFLIWPLLFWETYSNLSKIVYFVNKITELNKILDISLNEEIKAPVRTFDMIFKSQQWRFFITTFILYIIYSFIVFIFFNRKKIKEQFNYGKSGS